MAISVILTDVIHAADGKKYVRFANGDELEFADMAGLQAWLNSAETPENAQKLCVATAAAKDPTLVNLSTVKDKEFVLDVGAAYTIGVKV